MLKTILLVSATAAVIISIAFCILVAGTRSEIKRLERLRERMTALRDRAKRDPPDTNALELLIRYTQSKNRFERTAAIAFIGQVGSRAEPAVNSLIAALNGVDPYDAREAAQSLGLIGPRARQSIPALLQAVQQHTGEDIGWCAAEALGKIANTNDLSVIAVLQRAAQDPNPDMRHSAARALDALSTRPPAGE